MKHTDLYDKYKKLDAIEREELKQAVLAHGGEFRFETEEGEPVEGVQSPIVIAGERHWESYCECIVSRVVVRNDYLEIYGYAKEWRDGEILLDVEIGNIGYIIDEISETDEVHDVSIPSNIKEIAVINLCREDIKDAGYSPNISDDELQQIASRIGKYLEWQEFWPQFYANVKEACDYLGIPELENQMND